MSDFFTSLKTGKSTEEIRKETLTKEGTYPSIVKVIMYNDQSKTVNIGFETSVKENENDRNNLMLWRRFDTYWLEPEHIEQISAEFADLGVKDFGSLVKWNPEIVNFVLFLNEVGCLRGNCSARFSPSMFFGRKVTLRVKHTVSKNPQTGAERTYANTNILNLRNPETEPADAVVVPRTANFDQANPIIVKMYQTAKPFLPEILKAILDSQIATLETGMYDLEVKKMTSNDKAISLLLAATNDKGTRNTYISLRKGNIYEVDFVRQLFDYQSEKVGDVSSPEKFVGLRFSAMISYVEGKYSAMNAFEGEPIFDSPIYSDAGVSDPFEENFSEPKKEEESVESLFED